MHKSLIGHKNTMAGRTDEILMAKMLDSTTEKGESIRQLACKTGINCKTVTKFVHLIMKVQSSPRLKLEIDGLRVLVKRERPDSPKLHISESLPNQAKMR